MTDSCEIDTCSILEDREREARAPGVREEKRSKEKRGEEKRGEELEGWRVPEVSHGCQADPDSLFQY